MSPKPKPETKESAPLSQPIAPSELDKMAKKLRSQATALVGYARAIEDKKKSEIIVTGKMKMTRADNLIEEFLGNMQRAMTRA